MSFGVVPEVEEDTGIMEILQVEGVDFYRWLMENEMKFIHSTVDVVYVY